MIITGKIPKTIMVDVPIKMIWASNLMRNIDEGLWQSLNRKSFISGKTFPAGSNIVMCMYELEGKMSQSGACHLEELPDSIREVIETGKTWHGYEH